MNLEDLEITRYPTRVAAQGVYYRTGPFVVRLRTEIPDLLALFDQFYGASWATLDPAVAHFLVDVLRPVGIRRWFRAQALFQLDETLPFEPYPLSQAFPLLEWGLNWGIGTRAHQYLMLHAGALERDGHALLLPAMPGAGKSTLSAALAYRGWRFLSDEFGLVRPDTGDLIPLPRAVPLKNRSIPVIREYLPDAFLGPLFPKTRKGAVAHLRPPRASIERQSEPSQPRWIVFPQFSLGLKAARLAVLDKSLGFTRLAQNSFNYRLLGETGFHTLVRLMRECECYSLVYGELDAAVAAIADLTDHDPP